MQSARLSPGCGVIRHDGCRRLSVPGQALAPRECCKGNSTAVSVYWCCINVVGVSVNWCSINVVGVLVVLPDFWWSGQHTGPDHQTKAQTTVMYNQGNSKCCRKKRFRFRLYVGLDQMLPLYPAQFSKRITKAVNAGRALFGATLCTMKTGVTPK